VGASQITQVVSSKLCHWWIMLCQSQILILFWKKIEFGPFPMHLSSGHTQNPNPINQTLNYVLQHNGLLRGFQVYFMYLIAWENGNSKWCNFLDSQSYIDVKRLSFRLFFVLQSFSKSHQMYIYHGTRAASTHVCRRMN
jgi:hypothetical protein